MFRRGQALTHGKLNERLATSANLGSYFMVVWLLPLNQQPEEETAAPVMRHLYRDTTNGEVFVYVHTATEAHREAQGALLRAYLPGMAGVLLGEDVGELGDGTRVSIEWNTRLSRWDLIDGPLFNHGASFGDYDCRVYRDRNSVGIGWRWYKVYPNQQCTGWSRPCYEGYLWHSRNFDTGLPLTKTSTYPSVDTAMPLRWNLPAYPSSLVATEDFDFSATYDGEVSGQNQWSTKWAANGHDYGGEWIIREDDDWGITFAWNDFIYSLASSNMESVFFSPIRLNQRLMTAPLPGLRPPEWLTRCRGELSWPLLVAEELDLTVSCSVDGGSVESAEIVGYDPSSGWYGFVIKKQIVLGVAYSFEVFLPSADFEPVLVSCFKSDGAEITLGELSIPQNIFWDWMYVGVTDLELFRWEGIIVYGSST